MATKKNLKVSEAKKIADKLKSRLSKKTIARYKAQGQNNPQSKSFTEVADEGEKSKRIGMRWTDDGAKKAGKKPNSPVSASDKEKYGGKTFKGKLKGKDGKVDRRYIYTERRVDKSDKSASAKFKEGGTVTKKVRQKGSQSGNPTPSMDKVHQAKPVGWRFRGNKYRKPSEAHINRQLKLSPSERDIYFERRKDKSDYDFDRRFEGGGMNEYAKGGKVRQKGSQSGNPTPSMDKVHQAKPVGWRFRGNKYRQPSEAHVERQLKLSPSERDIYFERRKDKSDYSFERRFARGGFVTNLEEAFASDDLLKRLKSKMKDGEPIVAFAYTDYGGDFFDKVAIEYFLENYPENIVVENTAYSGKNGVVFGEPAKEFLEATESYLLGFDDLETFYYEKEHEVEQEDYKRFLDDLATYDNYKVSPEALDWLLENKGGYYSITTQGLDFSSSDLEEELVNEGLIEKKDEDEYKSGGKIRQKGSQSGNPTPSMDKVHQAKPVGWRFRGNKYRKPSEAHVNRQLKLSPDERDIYFERRKDKSDYDFDRRFEGGGMNEYAKGGGVTEQVIKIDVNGMLFFSLREFFDYCDANINKGKNVDFSIEYVVDKYKTKFSGEFEIYFVPNMTFNQFKREITEKYSEYNWSKMADGGMMAKGGRIVKDRVERQRIINSIRQGETILRGKVKGEEREAIIRQVNKEKQSLGLDYDEKMPYGYMAKGGGVPKEFGGRYNGVYNDYKRDVPMDKEWVAKPIGYRFTNDKAKDLRVDRFSKPTPKQVKKYLGDGVYFENREDKSDINQTTGYMSGGTTDGNWVSAFARGGVERISNRDARDYAENMLPFKGANLEGKTLSNGDYVVLSYGYYPIWYYCKHEGKWYGNSTKYSMTTSKQMSQSRPTYDATMLTRNELEQRMLKGSEKYAEGGVLSAIMGDTDGATMQNVGGTTFSNANLTSHMDITNPAF